jgi:hypothetical protein
MGDPPELRCRRGPYGEVRTEKEDGVVASKRAIRRKACDGKVRYATAAEAFKAAGKTGKGVTHYKCRFCGKFHCGHEPGGQKRRRQNGHG